MKTTILTTVLLALGLSTQAQTFEMKGDVNTKQFDGLTIYLFKTDVVARDKNVQVDSCKIVNGQYHFSVAAPDSACWALVALPPKDLHFDYGLPELNCILEKGQVEADCHDYVQTLKGGTLNQQYDDMVLTHDREVRHQVDQMMQQRQEAERKRPYTDAENEAYSRKLTTLYQGSRKYLNAFIAANIDNKVGARLLLTYGKDYFPADFYAEMCRKVNPVYLHQAERLVEAEAEAQREAEQARKANTVGNSYKDFVSKTQGGKTVHFSDYVQKGKVTLLDFWASWCGPCIQETKDLKELYSAYHGEGFNVVSVSLDTNRQKWAEAIKKHDLPWTHISSLQGFKDPGALAYAVQAIPYIVLIDRNGNIVLQNMHGPVLHKTIKEMFK